MHEIRLALWHSDEACRAVAARLRGAVVEPCADLTQLRGPPVGCNAVMLGGQAEKATVESLLSGGMHVVLVADPYPAGDVIEGLVRTAIKAGVQFAAVNPDRYLPSRQLIRQQLRNALGEPGLVRLHRWEPARPIHQGTIPDPLLRDLDTTLWLMGRPPNCVYAVEQKSDGRYVQVHLGFPGGGMAVLDYTDRLPPGDGYQSLSVIAASGAAYADDHQNMQLAYRGGCPQAIRTEERARQHAAIAQEFVDALREGRDLMTANAAEWRNVYSVAEAVQQSLASGRAVTLEDR